MFLYVCHQNNEKPGKQKMLLESLYFYQKTFSKTYIHL